KLTLSPVVLPSYIGPVAVARPRCTKAEATLWTNPEASGNPPALPIWEGNDGVLNFLLRELQG
ncbi:MAG: hypothetical protein V4719_24820, partial [Planctomycetota bacterium]